MTKTDRSQVSLLQGLSPQMERKVLFVVKLCSLVAVQLFFKVTAISSGRNFSVAPVVPMKFSTWKTDPSCYSRGRLCMMTREP